MGSLRERLRRNLATYVTAAIVLLIGVGVGVGLERNAGTQAAADQSAVSTVVQTADRVTADRARGKRGRRGRPGPEGPRGFPGASGEQVTQLAVDWNGAANAAGNDTASITLPGIGVLTLSCPASDGTSYPGPRKLTLAYGANPGFRTVATLNTLQGSDMYPDNVSNVRQESTGSTIDYALPNNGMITGTFSAETVSGDGSSAGELPGAQITMSSSWKTNDPNPADNFCHLSAQVIAEGT